MIEETCKHGWRKSKTHPINSHTMTTLTEVFCDACGELLYSYETKIPLPKE